MARGLGQRLNRGYNNIPRAMQNIPKDTTDIITNTVTNVPKNVVEGARDVVNTTVSAIPKVIKTIPKVLNMLHGPEENTQPHSLQTPQSAINKQSDRDLRRRRLLQIGGGSDGNTNAFQNTTGRRMLLGQ